jgi:hypothetical protein
MLVSVVKTKSKKILAELQSILNNDQAQLLVAENSGAYSEENDYYISSCSIIIDAGESFLDEALLDNFNNFLKKELQDISISTFSKHFLNKATEDNVEDDLIQHYKHLLNTAINIEELDPNKSWQEQFKAQKQQNQNLERRPKKAKIESPSPNQNLSSPQASSLVPEDTKEVAISQELLNEYQILVSILNDRKNPIPESILKKIQESCPNIFPQQPMKLK